MSDDQASDGSGKKIPAVFRKTKTEKWAVMAPVADLEKALAEGGKVDVLKKSGDWSSFRIASLGRPFDVDGVEMCYGYADEGDGDNASNQSAPAAGEPVERRSTAPVERPSGEPATARRERAAPRVPGRTRRRMGRVLGAARSLLGPVDAPAATAELVVSPFATPCWRPPVPDGSSSALFEDGGEVTDRLRRRRTAEEVALHQMHAELAQPVDVSLVLDALGHDARSSADAIVTIASTIA